jgi:hypothetical protein
MTERERKFADAGFDFCEGIDRATKVIVPHTGREILKVRSHWETQPYNDNYWKQCDNVLDALIFATPPQHLPPASRERQRVLLAR